MQQLNTDQTKAFNRLKAFIKDKNINSFILNGYAGTGKTFLIQHFANYLTQKKIKFALLATTGRAAAILRGKTEMETSTIHSALYHFSKINGDHEHLTHEATADEFGQMTIQFKTNERLAENCIYIVDESSMLASEASNDNSFAEFGSGELLHDLLQAIGNNNKIIFVGDDCQLPPIDQENSPALDEKYLQSLGRRTASCTLEKIMRTDEQNDILLLADSVRQEIGTIASTKWIKLPAQNRNNCSVLIDANALFLKYFDQYQQSGSKECIGIAHSNNACKHINGFFRKRLYPNSQHIVEPNEILIVNQNNYIIPVMNGDFIKVLELGEIHSKVGLRFQNIRLLHLLSNKEYEIKLALDAFSNSKGNLTGDQQRNLMIDFSRRMRKKNIKPGSGIYIDALKEDSYLNSLRAGYGYVITCHKAQGGEWKNVFLFLNKSMYGFMKTDAMRRWWYTAITRTQEKLYVHYDWWIK